ncbi:MAG TPA: class I SAM-dependent methyltransferase [Solirubrobacteraceae bacterium]|nr:class I SAM-dependent methyltransferase [Solirubrobacteraceae bacterium]
MSLQVIWHDLECGGYAQDLPLWRELAQDTGGPVLDVGAGAGRVALDLARRGHQVVALDRDEELLAALRERADGAPVETIAADAREFAIGRRFPLVLVPMQTLQLLGGAEGRRRFLARAREHLEPGGLLAAALADALEGFDEDHPAPPLPDLREVGGVVYASRPVAVRDEGEQVAIERLREIVTPDGGRSEEGDIVRLDRVDAATVAEEARAFGLEPLAPRAIAATEVYVGSAVVMLRG